MRPISFGQTQLAMSASANFENQTANTMAGSVFDHLSFLFAEHFKQEGVIDDRRRKDFLENYVPSAPPLTKQERDLIDKSLSYQAEVKNAARIAGSASDPVEKFLLWEPETKCFWGKHIAKIDCSCYDLFSKIWVINTYERNNEYKELVGNLPRALFENLDG